MAEAEDEQDKGEAQEPGAATSKVLEAGSGADPSKVLEAGSGADPSPTESVVALHHRIAELEQQLEETALLHERVAVLEERKLGTSLEGIKDELGKVEGRMGAIESRRDAWIRTLLLTIAAPLAAGVFGQVTKQRDVQLKKFEQNLDLVDRALEFEKGPAYRKATLEYILDVNEAEEPIAVWAGDQLEMQVKPQFDDVKSVADSKVEEVKALEEELERSAAELEKLDETLEKAASGPEDPKAFEQISRDATERKRVVDKAQDLQQRIETETESANALLNQAGQAPIVTAPMVEEVAAMEAEDAAMEAAEPRIYIQVASFNSERLVDAQAHIDQLDSFPTLLLFREPFYVVMVGPYPDAETAREIIEGDKAKDRNESKFQAGTKIRNLNEFCAIEVRTADALVCTPG